MFLAVIQVVPYRRQPSSIVLPTSAKLLPKLSQNSNGDQCVLRLALSKYQLAFQLYDKLQKEFPHFFMRPTVG